MAQPFRDLMKECLKHAKLVVYYLLRGNIPLFWELLSAPIPIGWKC